MVLSIVHEIAVLYSTRIHQHDKKWADGRLRFYELNNKMEIYNEDMTLVCTDFYPHHCRLPIENGVFANDKTYILPGGKLILHFTDYMGCCERDLSQVFVKKEHHEGVDLQPTRPQVITTVKQEAVDFGSLSSAADIKPPKNKPRPIGLTRRHKALKQPQIQSLFHVSVDDHLDRLDGKRRRQLSRVPPGSNRFSLWVSKNTTFEL